MQVLENTGFIGKKIFGQYCPIVMCRYAAYSLIG
jgi:hypothetical protein